MRSTGSSSGKSTVMVHDVRTAQHRPGPGLVAERQIGTKPERQYRYGVAFPRTYRPIVKRRIAPSLMKRLQLSFFFVDGRGKVEHVQWKDWSEAA